MFSSILSHSSSTKCLTKDKLRTFLNASCSAQVQCKQSSDSDIADNLDNDSFSHAAVTITGSYVYQHLQQKVWSLVGEQTSRKVLANTYRLDPTRGPNYNVRARG